MSISDIMLQNFMPTNILDSDDEVDTWSLGGRSSGSSQSSESSAPYISAKNIRDPTDFRLFQDYFGLSNLLNNIKISEDNPLLYNTQKALLQRARRLSWESDASDAAAVLSPTIDNAKYNFDRHIDGNNNFPINDAGFKQLPPPSMRLSKAMRDHIISGAYQQEITSRPTEKIFQPPQPSQIAPCPSPPQPQQQPPKHPVINQNVPNVPVPPRTQAGLQVCVFCRNNGESESVYTSHVLKDSDGRTACPILRAYTCPICKANGDNSHTIKYCPMNQNARVASSLGGVMGQQPQQPMNLGQRNNQQPPRGNFRPSFPPNLPPPNHPRFNPHPGKLRL